MSVENTTGPEKQKNWFVRHKVWTGILIFIAVIMVMGAAGGKNSSTSTTSKATATPTPETAIIVDYKAFGDEFDANQVAAEQKYKGKLVQFSAPISNITDSGLSFQNASSKTFSLTQISCGVTDKNVLVSVKNGQTVTVAGKVIGQTIGVIGLDDCHLVQ